VVLATCPFVYLGGQYANHDMLVAGTIRWPCCAWPPHMEARALGWLVAGWAACGLAVLSKG